MNMAYKNAMLFNKIKDSGFSEAQLEAIYPKVGSCNAVDGVLCVGELTGQHTLDIISKKVVADVTNDM